MNPPAFTTGLSGAVLFGFAPMISLGWLYAKDIAPRASVQNAKNAIDSSFNLVGREIV